jgi:hypothetical protein
MQTLPKFCIFRTFLNWNLTFIFIYKHSEPENIQLVYHILQI